MIQVMLLKSLVQVGLDPYIIIVNLKSLKNVVRYKVLRQKMKTQMVMITSFIFYIGVKSRVLVKD